MQLQMTSSRVLLNFNKLAVLHSCKTYVWCCVCVCVCAHALVHVRLHPQGLYMDAVLLFPDAVTEFLDLMTEKELRLRAPMEEVEILMED